MIDKNLIENWMDAAEKVAKNSYSPYSNFKVSCLVVTHSGNIFCGTNVENASYGITNCAERVAIGNAVSAGDKDIWVVVIYANVDSAPPCGMCRQFIIEFGEDIIVAFKYKGEIIQKTILELLPFKFSF